MQYSAQPLIARGLDGGYYCLRGGGCWVVGLLGCWVVGLLGCWVVGLLGKFVTMIFVVLFCFKLILVKLNN